MDISTLSRLKKELLYRATKLPMEEIHHMDEQLRNMFNKHNKWIATPEGLLEVLANPDVVSNPHLSPTFLYRDEEMTHEEKQRCYGKDYQDYYERNK